MAEFKISRIRYTWKNLWTTSTSYIKDDIVRYGGSTWVCIRQHTASIFLTDQTYIANLGDSAASPAWVKMTDGYAFRSAWTNGILYNPGDLVVQGGRIYLCVTSHTSQPTFDESSANWATYSSSLNWRSSWAPATRYGIGDEIKYGGVVYQCTAGHTSANTSLGLEANQASWTIVNDNVEYKGAWATDTRYKVNDLVKYSGTIFRCNTHHTSSSSFGSGNFTVEFPGFKFITVWNNSTAYSIGDMVQHGGWVYKSLTNNSSKNPGDSIYQPTLTLDWKIVSKAINFRGEWANDQTYKTGDVVNRGGNLYKATLDTTDDGSSLDYLDSGNWELLTVAQNWRDSWEEGAEYATNDIVTYIGSTYSCNLSHTASTENFPGDNGSGFAYWDLVIQSGDNQGMTTRGDLLTFDISRSAAGDASTINETAVPVGEADQLTSINTDGSIYYKDWGHVDKVRYVSADDTIALDDTTDPDRGINPFKPWRTIRFACEQVEAQGINGQLTTIKILPGIYDEILPIIIPVNVALHGEEIRSVTVRPKSAIAALANDSSYSIAAMNRLNAIVEDVLTGTPIIKSPSNTETQVILTTTTIVNVSFVPARFDGFGNEIYQSSTVTTIPKPISGHATLAVQNLIANVKDYINFHINSTGIEPIMEGSNTAETTQGFVNAAEVLLANKDFFAAELSAFIAVTFPGYVYDEDACKRDTVRYIEAFAYDIIYTGNYKTLYAARYYRNAVLGSSTEDMFYVRNATGVRNMTLDGLTGTLSPPSVNEIYRRPTGGSYVSLDPGWGPDDERTWITTRSCYIQNCTTFGENCVGQKIDGSLHNGGNKSIVSNDFTQIISDGIGAWVSNNGRAELVSVFTYYAQVGMFAEAGGVIRATNGNSSYGDFGAVATGNDPTETPRFGYVNNQTGQATIARAFAGEVNDEILILEYNNAGQNYSTANYSFVGSGINASAVHEEIRDGAIFEMQVRNPFDDLNATPGGSGYTLLGNNAQTGTTTTITLATNDESTEAELLGLRIIITSGDGTGQYGYVHAYNPMTKQLQVRKETTGEAGWDHVIPGTPSVASMTTNATYRFEPRITFAAPPYSAEIVNLNSTTTWANVVYGETKESYSALVGTLGAGTTVGVTPVAATWNVTKVGREYLVTINSAGAGYADEQVIVIDGSDVGGITDENDITIIVKSISDDSTNSILTFEWTGIAQSGRFVATPSAGTSAVASLDGETWTALSLPTAGEWKCLAAGDNKFVAIRYNSDQAAFSEDGVTWSARTMPSSKNWNSVTYGNGVFLAVAGDSNAAAYSLNGQTWTATTLPDADDSVNNEWVDVAYGKGVFVALANSNNSVGVGRYNSLTDTWLWTHHIMDIVNDSSQKNWTSIAYGNNRFVTVSSTGEGGWSFDGAVWYPQAGENHVLPEIDDSTEHFWKKVRYGQGVFFAVGDTGSRDVFADPTTGPTTFAATSFDGVNWTTRLMPTALSWTSIAFGNPDISLGDSTQSNSRPMWIAVGSESTSSAARIFTGARALGRAIVEAGRIRSVRIWEPGSGYTTAPTYTIIDPSNVTESFINLRLSNGVLAQPGWINRGSNYKTSSTSVSVLGDGFADVIPNGQFVTISGLELLPGPGTQFRFRGETNYFTVATIELESTQSDGSVTAVFRIGPVLDYNYNLQHNTEVEIRERYSQVRITGHDFLDIGTGNFTESNYPALYSANNYVAAPENEVVELDGGRVFYTSTDQNGNFRTGELFAVEQSTGIVTISADFFDLQGLTELALGGVRLGGSGAVVREFSTDTLFTADSNNIVPTQRAIKAYLQTRLNVGGSDLLTASFIAGTVRVGPNLIRNTAGLDIVVPVIADFSGPLAHISGSILAQNMFFRSFKDD